MGSNNDSDLQRLYSSAPQDEAYGRKQDIMEGTTMDHTRPSISVVIPAFNEEEYLPKSLGAIKAQEFDKPYEVIVVDNNSTDNSKKIARSFAARVVTEKKQGLIFAKDAGCDSARAPLVVVLDADNVTPPDWLKTIEEVLSDASVAAITGPYLLPGAPWWARIHTTAGIYFIRLVQWLTGSSPHIWGGNTAFRKADFVKIGGYDTRFSFAADEVKLRKELRKYGRIRQDMRMAVVSSTRRFKKGFFYFYVTFLLKGYILNYLFTSLFKRTFAHPENVREEVGSTTLARLKTEPSDAGEGEERQSR